MKGPETESLPLRNIKLKISYDGSRFLGWQRQSEQAAGKGRTVQEEIEKALEKMHGHPVPLIGSGRTDSGVHAAGQAANFHTDIARIPPERFVPALNSLLPLDVRIMDSCEVPPSFHARFDARARTYRFFLHCGSRPCAHEMPYVWALGRWPDVRLLNRMASCLRGEIDCSAFTASGDQSKTRTRYLYGARFFPEGEKLVFEISANAFLWKMVRSILGTLIDLERRGAQAGEFSAILESRDRSRAGPTAPGTGLFLWDVRY
ncbi:MAG TPA: tRNA pseudouridine(38-40) synthase TruA [Treponemataceae bacterium]|nr:tRNA pseudouridine(38-40) synthase TruA [Treponemataceae bacterium]